MQKFWLYILILTSFAGIFGFVWQMTNSRGYGRRGFRRRNTDRRRNIGRRGRSANEKHIVQEAQRLLRIGKTVAAARLFEANGMLRDAVILLESKGMINEAARMLIAASRPNRAGFVYARHGKWVEAANMFRTANMPLETAKSLRESGNLNSAAKYFEKVGRLVDAAECYQKSGNLQRAARLFKLAGNEKKALELYKEIASNAENSQDINLEDDEVKLILEHSDSETSKGPLSDHLVQKKNITSVLSHFLKKGELDKARDVYLKSTEDIGPQLIRTVSYSDKSAEALGELFMKVSQFDYAGAVFERIGWFEKAGEAFEKAEDYDLAAKCYERAGMKDKAFILIQKNTTSNPSLPVAVAESRRNFEEMPPIEKPTSENPKTKIDVDRLFAFNDYSEDTFAGEPSGETKISPIRKSEPVDVVIDLDAKQNLVKIDDAKPNFHRSLLWNQLNYQQRESLWNIGETREYKKSALILDYDGQPDGVYVVLQGSVGCFRLQAGQDENVGDLVESDSFGELWLLTDIPTTVKFVAHSDAKIHVVTRENFNRLIEKDGRMARKVYQRFTKNLMRKLTRDSEGRKISKAS